MVLPMRAPGMPLPDHFGNQPHTLYHLAMPASIAPRVQEDWMHPVHRSGPSERHRGGNASLDGVCLVAWLILGSRPTKLHLPTLCTARHAHEHGCVRRKSPAVPRARWQRDAGIHSLQMMLRPAMRLAVS